MILQYISSLFYWESLIKSFISLKIQTQKFPKGIEMATFYNIQFQNLLCFIILCPITMRCNSVSMKNTQSPESFGVKYLFIILHIWVAVAIKFNVCEKHSFEFHWRLTHQCVFLPSFNSIHCILCEALFVVNKSISSNICCNASLV